MSIIQTDTPCAGRPVAIGTGAALQGFLGQSFADLSQAADQAQMDYQGFLDSGDTEARIVNGGLSQVFGGTDPGNVGASPGLPVAGSFPGRVVAYPVTPPRTKADAFVAGTGNCGDYFAATPDTVAQANPVPLSSDVVDIGRYKSGLAGLMCNAGPGVVNGTPGQPTGENNNGWLWVAGLALVALAMTSEGGK